MAGPEIALLDRRRVEVLDGDLVFPAILWHTGDILHQKYRVGADNT